MNKMLAKLVAAGLVAVSLAAVACNAQKTPSQLAVNTPDAVSDASPTPAELISQSPTEAPTPTAEPTPTPEPTATPIPWPTDPLGHIPNDVEIIIMDIGITSRACVSRKDGKYFCQIWEKGELFWETEIPEELLEDSPQLRSYGQSEFGSYVVVVHEDATQTIFHKTEKGIFLKRGIPGDYHDGQYELLIAPKTLVWFNLHWDSYYYQKVYPKEIEFISGPNAWVWKGTDELVPVNFETTGEKVNFPQ